MSALSADNRRIFARFDAKVAARRSDDGFISIGTSALELAFYAQYYIQFFFVFSVEQRQSKADIPIEINPSSDRRAATFASNPAKILRWSADRALIWHSSADAPANLTRS